MVLEIKKVQDVLLPYVSYGSSRDIEHFHLKARQDTKRLNYELLVRRLWKQEETPIALDQFLHAQNRKTDKQINSLGFQLIL